MAREAAEAVVSASYDRGVVDMETRLAEEVVIVCRGYYTKSWGVAMDRARVPIDSELRRIENTFFPKEIQEISDMVPPPKRLLTSQAPSPNAEVSKGARAGKEAQPPMKAKPSKDTLTIKDVVSQDKEAELKSQAEDSQSEKVDPQKDPPQAKA